MAKGKSLIGVIMSGNINFGSLTIFINGRAVNLSNYDDNNDGKLQGDELKKLVEEFELDTFNLKSIDKNGDEELSPEEFLFWGEELRMEELLRQLFEDVVANDFSGALAEYQQVVRDELRAFLDDFVTSAGLEATGQLYNTFAEMLPSKYDEIKAKYLGEADDRGTVQENYRKMADSVTETIYGEVMAKVLPDGSSYSSTLSDAQKLSVRNMISTAALQFAKVYEGGEATFVVALTSYLENYISENEQDIMQDTKSDWELLIKNLGGYISQNEFNKLRKQAGKILETAVNNGIMIYYNNELITLENISKILNVYSHDGEAGRDTEALMKFINNVLNGLSDVSHLDAAISGKTNEIRITGGVVKSGFESDLALPGTGRKLSQSTLDMIDKVIDTLYDEYVKKYSTQKSVNNNNFGRVLEKEALTCMEANPFIDETELETYLRKFMDKTVFEALNPYIKDWKNAIQ